MLHIIPHEAQMVDSQQIGLRSTRYSSYLRAKRQHWHFDIVEVDRADKGVHTCSDRLLERNTHIFERCNEHVDLGCIEGIFWAKAGEFADVTIDG